MSHRRAFATIFSTLLHPIFYLTFVAYGILLIEPHAFGVNHWSYKKVFLLKVFLYTAGLPLISITMMRLLKFIGSVQMTNKNDRIVPLIACMVFYIWFYVNVKYNPAIPVEFLLFALGTTISLSITFITTIFAKISIHGVGIGGLLIYILTVMQHFNFESFTFEITGNFFQVHIILLFLICLVVSGIILSCRLLLGNHTLIQIYGGLLAGVISQMLANRILL